MTNLGMRLVKCGVICGEGRFKELLVDRYNIQNPGVPVDKFLCNPSKAIAFALSICKELGRTADQLPMTLILETLMNLRKQGAVKSRL